MCLSSGETGGEHGWKVVNGTSISTTPVEEASQRSGHSVLSSSSLLTSPVMFHGWTFSRLTILGLIRKYISSLYHWSLDYLHTYMLASTCMCVLLCSIFFTLGLYFWASIPHTCCKANFCVFFLPSMFQVGMVRTEYNSKDGRAGIER